MQKSISRLLVEPIKIVPCTPRIKLVSMQFQMPDTSSGRLFFFFHCGIVVCSDIMMDGLARVSVVLIQDYFVL